MQLSCKVSRIRFLLVLGLAIILNLPNPTPAMAQTSTEYALKAVFLVRFAEFVDWPPEAFTTAQSPIVFGVLGTSPFSGALEQAVQGERISGRSLEVRHLNSIQEVNGCHVVFFSRSETAQIPGMLAFLKGRSILTVSDAGTFVDSGGMIQFIMEGNHVRFKINRNAAEAGKLQISAKLLRLSQ